MTRALTLKGVKFRLRQLERKRKGRSAGDPEQINCFSFQLVAETAKTILSSSLEEGDNEDEWETILQLSAMKTCANAAGKLLSKYRTDNFIPG